ncbi:MFS transporter [Streptomyces roseirectus]|uniref:MFS transporter n=1 Tax=Streptomyces roseirectus TaxID=2768066 RepID=A0A7H0IA99_9ACTN|nr:oligopeptide:H+ symporter [Streptomyces roseirectus]QNP69715.1 MFS transporter [Streptomyces roseirectus]
MTAPAKPPALQPAEGTGRRGPLGWPRWFTTLFGTDIWERFSFYGMTAILVLYATEDTADGGLGLSNDDATLLFGLYMASVFLCSVPGGWLGDRLFGSSRAVLYGGVLIGMGHVSMAVPGRFLFYPGLLLIAAGTGLLKPNMANLLSAFYAPRDRAGRDAGFAIFYMSVQVSALAAPVIVGAVGETVDWHLGFGLAAVGMALGLVQYTRGMRHFGGTGSAPDRAATPAQRARVLRRSGAAAVVLALVYGTDAALGTFEIVHVMGLIGVLTVVVPAVFFWRLLRDPVLTDAERVRVRTYIWLFLASALFWAMFLQGGSVFSLFAKESTDRAVLGFTVPTSWFQSATPLFVLATAPLFAALWRRAGDRVNTAVKFGIGMISTALAFMVMSAAAWQASASDTGLVSPWWLVAAFLLLAAGEVAFAPVGMSATTAIAPATFVSQMVGLFWLAGALGGGLGGNALKASGSSSPSPAYFLTLALITLTTGTTLILSRRPLGHRLGV